ncbi:UNVERIFIED_CONTAM: hypothetical protein FKN15_031631 [Acipenser sinensis]
MAERCSAGFLLMEQTAAMAMTLPAEVREKLAELELELSEDKTQFCWYTRYRYHNCCKFCESSKDVGIVLNKNPAGLIHGLKTMIFEHVFYLSKLLPESQQKAVPPQPVLKGCQKCLWIAVMSNMQDYTLRLQGCRCPDTR